MSGIPPAECGTLTYRYAVRWEGVSVCVHATLYCGHTCTQRLGSVRGRSSCDPADACTHTHTPLLASFEDFDKMREGITWFEVFYFLQAIYPISLRALSARGHAHAPDVRKHVLCTVSCCSCPLLHTHIMFKCGC